MNYTFKNFLAILLFVFSLIFFMAANSINESSSMSGDCYHCGSISACRDGGQSYGWTGCDYFPEESPPNNCAVHGSSECSGGTDPVE